MDGVWIKGFCQTNVQNGRRHNNERLSEILAAFTASGFEHSLSLFPYTRTPSIYEMVKAATEKPVKSKMLSAAKSKKPSAPDAEVKSQPAKALTSDKPSTKAEGKRKSTSFVLPEDESIPQKKPKKASKTQASSDTLETVELVEGGKQEKETRQHATQSDIGHSRVNKRKQKETVSELEEEVQAPNEKTTKHKSASRKEQKAETTTPARSKRPSILSQPRKQTSSPAGLDHEDDPLSDEDKENGFEEAEEHLFGFSTDDEDSSDDEVNDEPDPIEVSKLPTIARDDATVKQKLEKAKRKPVSIAKLSLVCS